MKSALLIFCWCLLAEAEAGLDFYSFKQNAISEALNKPHYSVNTRSLLSKSDKTSDSSGFNRKGFCTWTAIVGTAAVHGGLYTIWYKDYSSSPFHFFNDNKEWLQMDKFGHAFSSYTLGVAAIEAAKWAGVPANKQWKWALFGSMFQDPIEIWDGLSSEWGASTGDLMANTFGTILCAGQHAMWKEQRIVMKYSYSPSSYAAMRPNALGSTLPESMLKDYNAQTYWFAYSPLKKKLTWLGFALGYGANGMLGGFKNEWKNQVQQTVSRYDIPRYRQLFLGLDYNLTHIKTKHKGLKTLFFLLNCIKLPSPALEYAQGRIKGHWMMF